jgi:hypothetical protein
VSRFFGKHNHYPLTVAGPSLYLLQNDTIMFTLGTSEGTQSKRVQKYLDVKYMDLEYTAERDGMGFVQFVFPTLDEDEFRNLVFLLKRMDGVTLMGVDSQLTEKNIMKLTKLLTELAPTTEEIDNPKYLDELKRILRVWSNKEYRDDRTKWEEYGSDIAELIQVWEDEINEKQQSDREMEMGTAQLSFYNESKEQKVRRLIRRTLRK